MQDNIIFEFLLLFTVTKCCINNYNKFHLCKCSCLVVVKVFLSYISHAEAGTAHEGDHKAGQPRQQHVGPAGHHAQSSQHFSGICILW